MIEILHRDRKKIESSMIKVQPANDNLEEFCPADYFKASQQTDAEVEEYVTCID